MTSLAEGGELKKCMKRARAFTKRIRTTCGLPVVAGLGMGMAGVLVGWDVVSRMGSVEVVVPEVSVVAVVGVGVVPRVVPMAVVRAVAARVKDDRPGMFKATEN